MLSVPPLSSYDNVPNVQTDNWSENISLALQLSKSWIDIMKSRNLHCLDNHPSVIYSNGISNRDKKVSNNTTNGAADTSNGVHSNIEVVASGFRISDCFKKGEDLLYDTTFMYFNSFYITTCFNMMYFTHEF